MTKLTRKLFVSILTLAFAVITLGATTFAWFTLSNKAEVQQFTAQVTSGAGIEISLNGTTYTSTITTALINGQINDNLGGAPSLDDVTSADGIVFNTLEDFDSLATLSDGYENDNESYGYIWFDLYFRSPEPNVKVYMLNNSYTGSLGVNWISDVAFNYRNGAPLAVAGEANLFAANSLRISYQEIKARLNDAVEPAVDYIDYPEANAQATATIYELDPTNDLYHAVDNPDGRDYQNQRLDTTSQPTYGSIAYWNAKYPLNQLAVTPTLPTTVLNNTHMTDPNDLVATPGTNEIATLDVSLNNATGTDYYYGKVRVRIWLEGWDPDMYNAIMADTIETYLNFGGSLN